jgi:hypothetical protein
VYEVDNSANHDECMKLLADAGIYLAVDVNTPLNSLNRDNPYTIMRSYNEVYVAVEVFGLHLVLTVHIDTCKVSFQP